MFSPQIPVTTCSRQVRGMSCSPSRRWDSVDFCGRGKKAKSSCDWSSLEFWNDARALFSSSTTGVSKPRSAFQEGLLSPGFPLSHWSDKTPDWITALQDWVLDTPGSNMSHPSTNSGSITCLDESSWGMNDTLKLVHINFPQRSSWLFSALMHFFTKFTSLTTISPDDQ